LPEAVDAPVAPTAAKAAEEEPAALVISHRFDPGPPGGPPYQATIRLTGHRTGLAIPATARDTFMVTQLITGVVPGSGPMSTTNSVYGIASGDWDVRAEVIGPERARVANPAHLEAVGWSWRRRSLIPAPGLAKTRWALTAPLAATPGVVRGSFFAAAAIALAGAVLVQPFFLAHHGVPVGTAISVSVIAMILGLVGAKAWYMALKGPSLATLREGWSVDGFLVSAPAIAIVAALLVGVPVGGYLDAVAPPIFLAVAVGRVGCFLTGCCAGRMTAGRGIWSSDRRVGARRIPAQLIESALGVALALAASALVFGRVAEGTGLVFVGSIAAYAAARQMLLRLRAESRQFSWRRAGKASAA
jgi:phosphatidylglycerol:prolipoprotein diacylglycerol transferase